MRMGRGTGGWYGEKGTQPTQQTQVVAAPKAAPKAAPSDRSVCVRLHAKRCERRWWRRPRRRFWTKCACTAAPAGAEQTAAAGAMLIQAECWGG